MMDHRAEVAKVRPPRQAGGQTAAADAIEAGRRACESSPERADLWVELGVAQYAAGQHEAAAQSWHQAVQLDPRCAVGYYNLATVFRQTDRLGYAVTCYERCLAACPTHREAVADLIGVHLSLGELSDALRWTRHARMVHPSWSLPCQREALAHKGRGDFAAALAAYDQALALDPDFVEAHYGRAVTRLQLGDWRRGWAEFAWRWRRGGRDGRPKMPGSTWTGQPLAGRKLLIWSELSLDEELLFSSHLGTAVAACGQAVIECNPGSVALFRRSFPSATVNAQGHEPTMYRPRGADPVDYSVALGDLPAVQCSATRPARPSGVIVSNHGWLVPDAEERLQLRERLASECSGLKVGLAWREPPRPWGPSDIPTDLAGWAPLLATPGVTWVNLEPGVSPSVLVAAEQAVGLPVLEWFDRDLVHDLDAMAARIAAMDLVIAVPSRVAHLAGALGKEAWVVATKGVDWHWPVVGSSPWYPTSEMFHAGPGGWAELMARLRCRLSERVESSGAALAASPAERAARPNWHRPLAAPTHPDVVRRIREAQAFSEAGDREAGLARLVELAADEPDSSEAAYQHGVALFKQKQYTAATAELERAIRLDPYHAFAHFYLAAVWTDLKRHAEALLAGQRALAIKADFPEAHLNVGAYLERRSDYDQALVHLLRAAELMREGAPVHYNLGNVRLHLGHLEESLVGYRRSLDFNPDQPRARWNQAMALLLLRRFAEGWPAWEYREAAGEVVIDKFDVPLWDGGSLAGKTVLIHAEQGVGDEIMFATCFPEVINEAEHAVVTCDPRLASLFRRSFPTTTVCPVARPIKGAWQPPIPVHVSVTAGRLPVLLRPTIESFPRQHSFLTPDPGQVAWWRETFASLGSGLKVGISWRANGKTNERRRRTAELEAWGEILSVAGIDWINLQYGECSADLRWVQDHLGVTVHDFSEGDPLRDLDGFAARVAALDLVFSIGNTTIHMAGAVGTPTWVVLPQVPGWRYMVEGDELLWYGSVRLFRQLRPGDWRGLFSRLAEQLRDWVAAEEPGRRSSMAAAAEPSRAPRTYPGQVAASGAAPAPQPRAVVSRNLFLDGLRHQRQGNLAEAERCFRAVLAERPEHSDALQLLGLVVLHTGRATEAIELMQRSLAVLPEQAVVHYNLGTAWEAAGKPDEALAAYQRATEIDPQLAEAQLNLGVAWLQRGAASQAEAAFRQALAARPDYAEAHNNLGHLWLHTGRAAPALDRFRQALTIRPDYHDAHRNLARALAGLGRTAEAVAEYDRLLAQVPSDAKALREREALRPASTPSNPGVVPPPHGPLRGGRGAVPHEAEVLDADRRPR